MFELVPLRGGVHTLRDLDTGETFHPVVGPMAEAGPVHIDPLQLEKRLTPGHEFTVWDVGLGAAANAVALIERLAAMTTPFHLRLVSFDRTIAPLRFALENAAALAYPLPWLRHLGALTDSHATRITFAHGGSVDWNFLLADFSTLPSAPEPDGIIYDPYSPLKNPDMWSRAHFSAIHDRLRKPCVLTSYSRSTAVRVTLFMAGFYVGIGGATGEKEQTTVASNELALLQNPVEPGWLDRVRKSTSARPLGEDGRGPISGADLAALERHPQFAI